MSPFTWQKAIKLPFSTSPKTLSPILDLALVHRTSVGFGISGRNFPVGQGPLGQNSPFCSLLSNYSQGTILKQP